MAFSIKVNLKCEYRGYRSGTSSKTNAPWLSLLYETDDSEQISVSVPSEMISDVYAMQPAKGDMHLITIRAVARSDGQSYVMLQSLPQLDFGADY